MLEQLLVNTKELHERFNNEALDADSQMRKLFEEVYELTAEVVDTPYGGNVEATAQEGIDVIVCVLGVLLACGVNKETIKAAVETVIEKNNRKSSYTHSVVKGLITRKKYEAEQAESSA